MSNLGYKNVALPFFITLEERFKGIITEFGQIVRNTDLVGDVKYFFCRLSITWVAILLSFIISSTGPGWVDDNGQLPFGEWSNLDKRKIKSSDMTAWWAISQDSLLINLISSSDKTTSLIRIYRSDMISNIESLCNWKINEFVGNKHVLLFQSLPCKELLHA